MAFYEHPDVMDNGLAYLKANTSKVVLISGYTLLDTYATVLAAVLAEADSEPADFTLATVGNTRTLTVAAKSDSSANASGGGVASHVALLDTANSKVLYVAEEDAAQTIVAGNPVTISSFVITRSQPVAA